EGERAEDREDGYDDDEFHQSESGVTFEKGGPRAHRKTVRGYLFKIQPNYRRYFWRMQAKTFIYMDQVYTKNKNCKKKSGFIRSFFQFPILVFFLFQPASTSVEFLFSAWLL